MTTIDLQTFAEPLYKHIKIISIDILSSYNLKIMTYIKTCI